MWALGASHKRPLAAAVIITIIIIRGMMAARGLASLLA